jgi:PEP-CTERM motif
MPNRQNSLLLLHLFACVAPIYFTSDLAVAAPTVWTGPTISFTKVSGADFTLQANQDQLTSNVTLTRGNNQGMFNILAEAGYRASSPAGTLWATLINNPGDTVSATNWAELDFTTWAAAFDNSVGSNILTHNAVVHLVGDDVYLDLTFTSYQGGSGGGGFTYARSTPVPEPATSLLLATGVLFAAYRRRHRFCPI